MLEALGRSAWENALRTHMKEYIDFNYVKQEHVETHLRLVNWGDWCRDRGISAVAPMFRNYKSKWRQWHTPEIRDVIDGIDAQRIQRLMIKLPLDHRKCLAWFYTTSTPPLVAQRALGRQVQQLNQLLIDSRQMINNLGKYEKKIEK